MGQQVLELRRKVLGSEHPDTLRLMNDLAFTHSELGRHEKALAMYQQVLELKRKILGGEHPDEREEATVAVTQSLVGKGIWAVRVHGVKANVKAARS